MDTRWNFNESKFLRRKLRDEYVLLNLDGGQYYTLEGTGAFVFDLILKGAGFEKIEAAVCKTYRVAPETASKDVRDLLKHLQAKKIIQPLNA